MAARTVNYYLIKVVRISAWFLFVLMVVYIMTGYALCGKFGVDRWLDAQQALDLHKFLDEVLVALFLIHSIPAMYLAIRRWTWSRRKKRT